MKSPRPRILPQPRHFRRSKGSFRLTDEIPIVLVDRGVRGQRADSEFDSARSLAEFFRSARGIDVPVESHARVSGLGPRIELSLSETRGHRGRRQLQGYELVVNPSLVRIEGFSHAGLRYGVETLKQLWIDSGRDRLGACRVRDEPAFECRGVLFDISRGKVPRPSTIIDFMDWMVSAKLNVLMLYTEHVFQFRRHPLIGQDASPLDGETLRSLDEQARRRHIELIPTLQSLGHMHHLLGIARYAHLAESEKNWSISPTLEESYALLEDLYTEYLPNFSSGWFNANCDEPVDLGKGLSKDWAERVGRGVVYRKHLERVRKLASKLGRRTMVWGDVVHEHPDEIPKLDRRLVFLDWWYEEDHDFHRVRKFKQHGIEFIVCPGTSSWNSLFPRLDKAFENIRGYARAGRRHGARGLINTDWGDNGHVNLLGNSMLAFAWGAELSWSRSEPEPEHFDRAFALQTYADKTARTTRILRALGSLHDAGFKHFNNSAIKTVFFDSLTGAEFLSQTREAALVRARSRIERLIKAWQSDRDRFRSREDDLLDLEWSLLATQFAVEKGLAAKAYLEWKTDDSNLTRVERSALAKTLRDLAARQAALKKQLRRRWLARSFPRDFSNLARRFSRSIRSLRNAARAVEPQKRGQT